MAIRFIDKIKDDSEVINLPSQAGIGVDIDTGELKYHNGTSVVAVSTGAAGSTVVAGVGTLDGSNPTSIATGLTTVTAFTAMLRITTVGAGAAILTHAAPVGGTVDVYAFDADASASTDTDQFDWIAVGS